MNIEQLKAVLEDARSPDTATRTNAEIQIKGYMRDSFCDFCNSFLAIATDPSTNGQSQAMALIVLKNSMSEANNTSLVSNWKNTGVEFRNNFLQNLESQLHTVEKNTLHLLSKIYTGAILFNKLYHSTDEKTDQFLERLLGYINEPAKAVGTLAYLESTISELSENQYEFELKEKQLIYSIATYYVINPSHELRITECTIHAISNTVDIYATLVPAQAISNVARIIDKHINNESIVIDGTDTLGFYLEAMLESNMPMKDSTSFTTTMAYFFHLPERTKVSTIGFCDFIVDLVELKCGHENKDFAMGIINYQIDHILNIALNGLACEHPDDAEFTSSKAACRLLKTLSKTNQVGNIAERTNVQHFVFEKVTSGNDEAVAIGALALGCVATETTEKLDQFYQGCVNTLASYIQNETAGNNTLFALSTVCETNIFLIVPQLEQITLSCGKIIEEDAETTSACIWFFYSTFVTIKNLPKNSNLGNKADDIYRIMSRYTQNILSVALEKMVKLKLEDSITRNALVSMVYEVIQFPMDQEILVELNNFFYNQLNEDFKRYGQVDLTLIEDKICSDTLLTTATLANLHTISDEDASIYFTLIQCLSKLNLSLIQGEMFMSVSLLISTKQININNPRISQFIGPLVDIAITNMRSNRESYSVNAACCFISDVIALMEDTKQLISMLHKIVMGLIEVIKREEQGMMRSKEIATAVLGDLALITGLAFSDYVGAIEQMYVYINTAMVEQSDLSHIGEMDGIFKAILRTVDCVVVGMGENTAVRKQIPSIVNQMQKTMQLVMKTKESTLDKALLDLTRDIYKIYRPGGFKRGIVQEFMRYVLLKNSPDTPYASEVVNLISR